MNRDLGLNFTDEQLDDVRHLIYSKAWTDFFIPYLTEQKDAAMILILNPSTDRKNSFPDDYLRGFVIALDRLMSIGHERLEEKDQLRLQQEQEAKMEQAYQDRVDTGHIGPLS
jgi:hypothetical protein